MQALISNTNHIRAFARRLIDHDELGLNSPGSKTSQSFHISDKLRVYLATLMGIAGFRALLSRALALRYTKPKRVSKNTPHPRKRSELQLPKGLRHFFINN